MNGHVNVVDVNNCRKCDRADVCACASVYKYFEISDRPIKVIKSLHCIANDTVCVPFDPILLNAFSDNINYIAVSVLFNACVQHFVGYVGCDDHIDLTMHG